MKINRKYRANRLIDKLLGYLDDMREEAERANVCPPDFRTRRRLDENYAKIREYLERQKYK